MRSRDVGHAERAASWTATDGWWPARVFWRSSLGRSAWAAANLSTPHRVRPGAVSSCDRTRAGRACAAGTGFDTRIGARTHKGRGAQRMAATARSPAWTPRPTQPPRQGRAVVNGTHAVPHSSQRHRQASAPRSQHATPLSPTTPPPAGTAGRFPAPARGSPARYGAGVPASAASRAPTPRQHAERPRPAPVAAEPRRDFRVGRIRLDRPGREGEGLLGYSDSSVLTRAFRRWSGKSPHEWRSEHAIAALSAQTAQIPDRCPWLA
jgi:hypothetical protein